MTHRTGSCVYVLILSPLKSYYNEKVFISFVSSGSYHELLFNSLQNSISTGRYGSSGSSSDCGFRSIAYQNHVYISSFAQGACRRFAELHQHGN